ncbi:pyridoxal phosphate biosynthesis protein [Verrucomicrobia bacterium SCGC AG-212-E04]|nr:pyridoxal phosphate biosynthesis protein [Verrucomicrobia bacterium SCGC AG-212-E04]
MESARRIAITLGDAAGIGPEITEAALASGRLDPAFGYQIIGEVPAGTVPGQPTERTARAAAEALEEAVRLVRNREVAAIVTGPVSKTALHAVGFSFPGQTEFLAARCGVADFAMILTGGALTVALVSIHVPLRSAIEQLSAAEIERVGRQLANFLRLRHRREVRIAVAGLNPHAGEGGTFGREEIEVIAPAVERLNRGGSGASFHGPLAPDTVFHAAMGGAWDGVLCMYHDQGLIPLKLHAFDEGVNVTWGLPILRTSPDHGTAFAIAGKGLARADSMVAALRLAAEIALARASAAAA